jgi:hypothetical protein
VWAMLSHLIEFADDLLLLLNAPACLCLCLCVYPRYAVRMVLLDLSQPPPWFVQQQAHDHLTLAAAQAFAGTDGEQLDGGEWGAGRQDGCCKVCTAAKRLPRAPNSQQQSGVNRLCPAPECCAAVLCCPAVGKVLLLTNPVVAGYTQNPISVYYCFDATTNKLAKCIAEVRQEWVQTNLPVCVRDATKGRAAGRTSDCRVCLHNALAAVQQPGTEQRGCSLLRLGPCLPSTAPCNQPCTCR